MYMHHQFHPRRPQLIPDVDRPCCHCSKISIHSPCADTLVFRVSWPLLRSSPFSHKTHKFCALSGSARLIVSSCEPNEILNTKRAASGLGHRDTNTKVIQQESLQYRRSMYLVNSDSGEDRSELLSESCLLNHVLEWQSRPAPSATSSISKISLTPLPQLSVRLLLCR
ncbi:hypothetical protein BDZ97DRAFT_1397674 [Flammula alnicola]|nr:hypothetical protein BDZ97DRAFT_1397674 [Flammula alnicola]